MGCSNCGTGGCGTSNKLKHEFEVTNGLPPGCKNNGACGINGCNKLTVFDWLTGIELPNGQKPFDIVEVRFKNTRKDFFRNSNNIELQIGDVIAVETLSGHDIGVVSLTGELVRLQMNKKGADTTSRDVKKIYRKARPADIEKWQSAQVLEKETMLSSRKIAAAFGLQMKISDVEYQGDKTKATFYYTAADRVDFRELIKKLAETFHVRIEMKQIGIRQEAGRIGGIGSCGRELCCSTWLTDFRTVTTTAARYQQLSLNPIKLAGQCGKLKCCLNYELDSYLDAIRDFPDNERRLKTKKGEAIHQKTDIFKRIMWYAYSNETERFIALPVNRVKEILHLNENGKIPEELLEITEQKEQQQIKEKAPDFENVVGQDDITRFDKKHDNRKKPHHHRRSAMREHSHETERNPRRDNPGSQKSNGKPPGNPHQGRRN